MEVSNKLELPEWEQDMYFLFCPVLLNSCVVSQKH